MNPFLRACGATGPLQLTVECQGVPGVETVEFDQPFLLIGRDPNADLHFPHADVSDRHVYLQVVGGHLCYVDLGSRSGTYLEGRCLRSGWLPLQKTLRIGPYRIRLVGGIAEEPEKATVPVGGGVPGFGLPPLRDAGPAPLTLELSHRGIRTSICPIHGELTLLGSSADCDVRILDPSVSNYHASLLHTSEGAWVVDLLGLAGITVNGDPVRSARVDDGDALRVGHSLVRVRCGGPAEETEAVAEPAPSTAPADLLPVAAPDASPRPALAGPQPAVVDAFLSPLVDQCRLMQRELFEQLRHELSEELTRAGAELVRQLTTAHHEHAQSLKRELDHFQRLNRELDSLKAELASRVAAPNGHERPGPAAKPPRLGTAMALPLARPFSLNTEGALTLAHSDPDHGLDRAEEGAGCPDAPVTVEEAQSWLYQRISMIQDEQQGRWQKLLSRLAV